ncbi:MAG: histidine kinase [Bacteroidetes bacterium]|nr:histidine kinase [Bacteroidota bacterium]
MKSNYKNLHFLFYLLVFLMFFYLPLQGNNSRKYSVTYFSLQNGVEDGLVNNIIQDHKGLLWFATWNGLYRFDGYNFKNFKSNTEDKKGLTNDRLLQIEEDKRGFIWVLCYDSTAYRFNPTQEEFEPVCPELSNFKSFTVFPNGIVWFMQDDGSALRISTDSANLSLKYQTFSPRNKALRIGKIRSVFLDSTNQEWILTDNGLFRLYQSKLSAVVPGNTPPGSRQAFYSALELNGQLFFGSNSGRIFRYSLRKKKLGLKKLQTASSVISVLNTTSHIIYVTDRDGFFMQDAQDNTKHYRFESLVKKTIESAQISHNDFIWFVHPTPGVSMFDIATQQLKFVEGKDELGKPLNTETGFFIIDDQKGNLWVHPKGGGFSYLDFQTRELIPFNTTEKQIKWKSNDRCFAAFADRQGNLWMSTQLNRLKRINFTPDKFQFLTTTSVDADMPDNEIRAVFIDKKNRVWAGSRDNNLSVYDSKLNLLQRFRLGKIYAVTQDADGFYWVSTKGNGLIRITETRPEKFDFKQYTFKANDAYSLSSNNIYYTFQDSKKRIWVATYGGGLNLVKTMPDGTQRFINCRNYLKKYPIERFYKIRHINEGADGRIWISTTSGILYFDGDFKKPEDISYHYISRVQGDANSLSNNDVQMTQTVKGRLFAITYGGGINELVKTGKYSYQCKSFTRKNGLISDIIYSMQVDKKGDLWLATGGGLVKFTDYKHQVQYPSEHIAFNVHFSEGVGATDGKRIFFGTNRGLFYFYPDDIHKNDFAPPIYFSSIWLNNEEITPKTSPDIMQSTMDDSPKITLPPNNHSFRLVFSALDMSETEYIQYSYKLDGFDKEYRLTNANHEANYTNLPPGKYTFHVKSTNNEGVWVNNEKTLSIEVLPSFSETIYAKILYIILIVFFILIAIYVYTVFYHIKSKARNEELLAQMKVNFFTDVSHELRTPLTLITGPVELVMTDKQLPGHLRETLELIKKNCDRMQRLVSQILDFSKIQENKMQLRIQHKDIVHFTQEVTGYFTPLAKERNINLTFSSEASTGYLWFDTDDIEKVIFNLLSNAFKHTPNGKAIAVIITEQQDTITIKIADEGVGIRREKQESIFNRFENFVQGNNQSALSSGIGLSVTKELVEMHKGKIWVESEVGAGSTFSVQLLKGKSHYPPDTEYILSDLSEEYNADDELVESTPHALPNQDVKMLIVEDNYELRLFIRQVFQDKYKIIEASDGEDGLNKAFSDLPDIIITDIVMPVMDGLSMLEELRNDERTSHIPSIVLTAKADMDSVLKGIQTGADDYITKPFSVSYLQAKVDNMLDRRKALQSYYRNHTSIDDDCVEEKHNLLGLSAKDAAFLDKIAAIMELQIANPEMNVDLLVKEFNLSRSNFFHKLKSLTGLSPIAYIKEFRMRKAAELIRENQYNMSEIAYMVGFSDPHYFSKSFKAYWGMNSTEYAKKYTTH